MTDHQKDLFQKFAALGSLLALTLVFSFVSEAFFSVGNGLTVALQVTSIAYLGIGATCVIITGGIDLSVGAILALSGVIAAMAVKAGAPVPLGMAAGTGTPALTSSADETPASASTEPTDRSMPPVMITHVAAMPR